MDEAANLPALVRNGEPQNKNQMKVETYEH
jgi:hypothetical protein